MYPQVFLLCIEFHFNHKSDYTAQKQLWARFINLKKKNKIVDADTSLLHTVLDCDGSSFSVHTGLSCFLSTALLAVWASRASCNNCINFCGRLIGNSQIDQRSEERKMNSHTHTHKHMWIGTTWVVGLPGGNRSHPVSLFPEAISGNPEI